MKGWHNESYRHMLARKGVSLGKVKGIPMTAEALPKGQIYPMSPIEVSQYFEKAPKSETKGLKRIAFVTPKDSQEKEAWARYVSSTKEIRIFSQPLKDGKISGEDPKVLNEHMNDYVLPHEMGHHVALRDLPVDKELSMAEARADAHVVGMDVADKDAKIFKSLHEEKKGTLHAVEKDDLRLKMKEFGIKEAQVDNARDVRGTADLMIDLARVSARRKDTEGYQWHMQNTLEKSRLDDGDKQIAQKKYKELFKTPGVDDKSRLEGGYFVIRKLPGQNKFRLYSDGTHRNLGTYPTKELAVKRERQVNFFKYRSKFIKKRQV